jgi:oligoribonuclease
MEKLLWVDLEMSGLDVEKEVIIEAAAIVTDLKFQPVDEYHSIVKQPQEYIDNMDDWNKKHHGQSGLIEQIPNGKAPSTVEDDLISLCEKHFEDGKAVLAGNSIFQDRIFIKKHFPRLDAKLHYRMLDVTSFKLIFNNLYSISYAKKQSTHRAMDDITESINELKKYLSFMNL